MHRSLFMPHAISVEATNQCVAEAIGIKQLPQIFSQHRLYDDILDKSIQLSKRANQILTGKYPLFSVDKFREFTFET